MRKIILILLVSSITFLGSCVFAQTSDTESTGESVEGNTLSVEEKVNILLNDMSNLYKKLRAEKRKSSKTTALKLRLIQRKIIRAVNSIPSESCYEKVKVAMDDFFALASDLGSGISCGPPIIPPFLDRINKTVTPDCIQPDQIGGAFSEVLGLYDQARGLFHIDLDDSGISDACEGT